MVDCFCPKLSLLPSPHPHSKEGSSIPSSRAVWPWALSKTRLQDVPRPPATTRGGRTPLLSLRPAGFALRGPAVLSHTLPPSGFGERKPQKRSQDLCCSPTPPSCTCWDPACLCGPDVTTAGAAHPLCAVLQSPVPSGWWHPGGDDCPGRALRTKLWLHLGVGCSG